MNKMKERKGRKMKRLIVLVLHAEFVLKLYTLNKHTHPYK